MKCAGLERMTAVGLTAAEHDGTRFYAGQNRNGRREGEQNFSELKNNDVEILLL